MRLTQNYHAEYNLRVRYLVTAKVKPGQEKPLDRAIAPDK
jgi:hypothetical protein